MKWWQLTVVEGDEAGGSQEAASQALVPDDAPDGLPSMCLVNHD